MAEAYTFERLEKRRVRLDTRCFNQAGEEVLVGEAVVIPPR